VTGRRRGVDPRAPCLVGVAQRTVPPGTGPAPEPMASWEEVCRAAAADTGAPADRVLAAAGSLDVLYCQSWPYDDPAGRLAARLGIDPARRAYSGIGGTVPQLLVAGAAAAIARGELDVGLVAGGEALETVRQAKKAGARPAWSHRDRDKKPFPYEAPLHPAEVAHQLFQAWLTFAVFDTARRARHGTDPATYRRRLGELLAPFTEVAEANPHAWFRTRRRAEELVTPGPDNRMVAYPYTKWTVAVMDVDMAAALVVCSHRAADDLGVPAERRVYLRGSGYAEDPVYLAEHDPMGASPAMTAAGNRALGGAGIGVDDVAHLDLYSCFGSSVGFACDALGLRPDDHRGFTVTGGLPFAGGPGSGYLLHSTAAMTDVLRADPGSYGMVSGVGMHMTKHAFGVYSTEPPAAVSADAVGAAAVAGTGAPRRITDLHDGPATVAAYTVVHARTGEPEWGLAVCDLADGSRAYARIDDPGHLDGAESTEWVGTGVELKAGSDRVNRVVEWRER
jgi:acetyl-CoA C-acetyltransferase